MSTKNSIKYVENWASIFGISSTDLKKLIDSGYNNLESLSGLTAGDLFIKTGITDNSKIVSGVTALKEFIKKNVKDVPISDFNNDMQNEGDMRLQDEEYVQMQMQAQMHQILSWKESELKLKQSEFDNRQNIPSTK